MADITFNTQSGATIERELMIAYLNTGTAASATWTPLGKRVSDSNEQYDWSKETTTDILGDVRTTLKKPTITQSFDPLNPEAGDAAIQKLWNLAVKDQDIAALAAQDMLIVHLYAGASSASFAERYTGCAIELSSIGGEGGGVLEMPIDVTYGGTRTLGTASVAANGTVTFTPDNSN